MSKCKIKRDFCLTHKCWVAVWDDPRCPVSAAEVERLTAANQALVEVARIASEGQQQSEAEVERLTAANEVLVVISVKSGKGMAQLTDQVDAVRRVLTESQTGIVAELREQIEAALSGEDEWSVAAERSES